MRITAFVLSLVAFLIAPALPVLAQEGHGAMHSGHDMPGMAAMQGSIETETQPGPFVLDSGKPFGQNLDAAMAVMHRDMATAERTGDPDYDFAAGMIPHHQGAIDMARTLLRFGKDPELRRLAEAIVAAQEKEIAFMREWMRKNQPVK